MDNGLGRDEASLLLGPISLNGEGVLSYVKFLELLSSSVLLFGSELREEGVGLPGFKVAQGSRSGFALKALELCVMDLVR